MRPRGKPPTPSAMSRLRLPVGIDSTVSLVASPKFHDDAFAVLLVQVGKRGVQRLALAALQYRLLGVALVCYAPVAWEILSCSSIGR
jgi:hypothetical protein